MSPKPQAPNLLFMIMDEKKKIKVLIVDDSAVVRNLLTTVLSRDEEIEVIGTTPNPFVARDKIVMLNPDIITLDVEMPGMDRLTFLRKLMTYYPIPVIMVSSLTESGCETTLKALEIGALDFVTKPKTSLQDSINQISQELIEKIKVFSKIKIKKKKTTDEEYLKSDKAIGIVNRSLVATTHKIIAIGASTGGTEAIKKVLEQFPTNTPGTTIVQHMPKKFTKSFAERLNSLCGVEVREAQDGDSVISGRVLIAPGNYHMLLRRDGARYYVKVKEGPLVSHHRPSVDVMFNSVAEYGGANAVGVILTGMGADGSLGMLNMKKAGAKTIAQDESSCVVFGMPKEAIKLRAVDNVVSLDQITNTIFSFLQN